MARRFVAGAGQLLVFLGGFGMFLWGIIDELRQFYGMMFGNDEPEIRYTYLWVGIVLAMLAWLWSLVSSLGLLREAKRNRLQVPD